MDDLVLCLPYFDASERSQKAQGKAQRRRNSPHSYFKPLQHRPGPSGPAPTGQAAAPPAALLRVLEIGALFLRTRAAQLTVWWLADTSK
ncbi:MAG: hypothetical protein ACREV3_12345 [Gammaproteobacteria bacterium]